MTQRTVTLRHRIEFVGVRMALALLDAFPRTAMGLAVGAADLAFVIMRGRRRIAIDNLLRAGLAADKRAARRLTRAAFRHFASVAVESVLAPPRLRAADAQRVAEWQTPEATRELFDDPTRGVILVTAHLGNWEVAGHLLSFRKPVTAVARRMNNPLAQRLLEQRSARGRITILPKRGAGPRRMLAALREGSALALLMDQHARRGGMLIPFFGTPAATQTSPARVHRLSGAPIVFCYALRNGFMRYRMIGSEPLYYPRHPEREVDTRQILCDLTARLEAAIHAAPEQYLWMHRRWR